MTINLVNILKIDLESPTQKLSEYDWIVERIQIVSDTD